MYYALYIYIYIYMYIISGQQIAPWNSQECSSPGKHRPFHPPEKLKVSKGSRDLWIFITGGCSGRGGAVDGGSII